MPENISQRGRGNDLKTRSRGGAREQAEGCGKEGGSEGSSFVWLCSSHHGHDREAAGVVGAAIKPHLRVAALQPEDLRTGETEAEQFGV